MIKCLIAADAPPSQDTMGTHGKNKEARDRSSADSRVSDARAALALSLAENDSNTALSKRFSEWDSACRAVSKPSANNPALLGFCSTLLFDLMSLSAERANGRVGTKWSHSEPFPPDEIADLLYSFAGRMVSSGALHPALCKGLSSHAAISNALARFFHKNGPSAEGVKTSLSFVLRSGCHPPAPEVFKPPRGSFANRNTPNPSWLARAIMKTPFYAVNDRDALPAGWAGSMAPFDPAFVSAATFGNAVERPASDELSFRSSAAVAEVLCSVFDGIPKGAAFKLLMSWLASLPGHPETLSIPSAADSDRPGPSLALRILGTAPPEEVQTAMELVCRKAHFIATIGFDLPARMLSCVLSMGGDANNAFVTRLDGFHHKAGMSGDALHIWNAVLERHAMEIHVPSADREPAKRQFSV